MTQPAQLRLALRRRPAARLSAGLGGLILGVFFPLVELGLIGAAVRSGTTAGRVGMAVFALLLLYPVFLFTRIGWTLVAAQFREGALVLDTSGLTSSAGAKDSAHLAWGDVLTAGVEPASPDARLVVRGADNQPWLRLRLSQLEIDGPALDRAIHHYSGGRFPA